jgi:enoyl-CoA hydratase/carnithine racemase
MVEERAPVLFHEHQTPSGHRIGFAQLNAERSLNSLTVEMVQLLDSKLRAWALEAQIALVVLSGAGSRAFCAGGDMRSLRDTIQSAQSDEARVVAGLDFFSQEYRLDYRIHRYLKPVLVWGNGIVMGGGIGLMAGASHRVVTETSRLAMPEVKIGLFPDVGASYFLGRLPRAQGHFIGLTGAMLNAHDALVANLASHFVAAGDREAIWHRLETSAWHDDAAANRAALDRILASFSAAARPALPISQLLSHSESIQRLITEDFRATCHNLMAYADGDPWLTSCAQTLRAGSPTSAALSWELLRRSSGRGLGDVFRMELTVALRCCSHSDLSEGVRALLVDKDNKPKWSPPHIDGLTPEWIGQFFRDPRWPSGVHPLADLS